MVLKLPEPVRGKSNTSEQKKTDKQEKETEKGKEPELAYSLDFPVMRPKVLLHKSVGTARRARLSQTWPCHR